MTEIYIYTIYIHVHSADSVFTHLCGGATVVGTNEPTEKPKINWGMRDED